MTFKAIAFIEKNDTLNGYFFYDAQAASGNGKIFGVPDLTLDKALNIMSSKGVEVIKNQKVSIMVYYHS